MLELKFLPFTIGDKMPDFFLAKVIQHDKENLSEGELDKFISYTTIGYTAGTNTVIYDIPLGEFASYDTLPYVAEHEGARYCTAITEFCELNPAVIKPHDLITLGEVKQLDKYFGSAWSKGL